MPPDQFGRANRTYDPRIPHLSALISLTATVGPQPPPPPSQIDYTNGMPDDFGEMGNDHYNDCTSAAFYHARQVWTFAATGREITEPDTDVMTFYGETCGYTSNAPPPGPTGNIQTVLTALLNKGAPIGPDGKTREFLTAFVEVDHRNVADIKTIINDCGIAYIGFPVPSNVKSSVAVWDYDPKAKWTGEGHAIVLAGYDANGAVGISWGKRHTLTWDFITRIVDEVYALVDAVWVSGGGKTPAGLTLDELAAQMKALKT
jgi:hypothetical protein